MTPPPVPTEMSPQLSRWKDEEADLLQKLDELETRHGFIPRDIAEDLSRILEVKLERLKRIQGKVESTARKEVEQQVAKWKDEEGNLIMILHEIQNEHGYVPREVAMELARTLGVKLARIYEVITFYHYFKLVPPGKHNLSVCLGTACYLKGANLLLNEIKGQLKISEGQTTQDRQFHLDVVRCIGCCGLAPALVADGKTYGKVRTADITEIVAKTRLNESRA